MRVSFKPASLKKTGVIRQPRASQLIRQSRQLTGLTQQQLATLLGVTYGIINRWENRHMQPSPLALKQIRGRIQEISQSTEKALGNKGEQFLNTFGKKNKDNRH